MKINRSSKLHFGKWLTKKKKEEISLVLEEYSNIVNYFISNYLDVIPEKKKFDLTLKDPIQKSVSDTGTWLSARMIKNAFSEGYGMCQSYKSNLENNENHNPPIHTGKKATLSCTINTQYDTTKTKEFDFNVTLGSIGNKMKISIPLKKHEHFNKLNSIGKRSSTIILTKDYIQFSFEIETGKKKEEGSLLGVDIGVTKLIATSDGEFLGEEVAKKINELHRKKFKSKGYYRKKEEIKEYINYSLNQLDWENTQLLVVEKLRNIKKNMKVKRRLTKTIRRVISNWNYAYVLTRLQQLSEINRVTFRSVPPFYTSQMCSACGHRDKRSRLSQEHFRCLKCGHEDNADTNAAKNVLNLFIMGKYGSHYKPISCEVSS